MLPFPSESILDVLRFLDRFSLDGIEFAGRLLSQIVASNEEKLSLRSFTSAGVSATNIDGVKGYEFRLRPKDPSVRWGEIRHSNQRLSEVIKALFKALAGGVILGNLAFDVTGMDVDESAAGLLKKHSRSVLIVGSLELSDASSMTACGPLALLMSCFQHLGSVYSPSFQPFTAGAATSYGFAYRTNALPASIVRTVLYACATPTKRVIHADELSDLSNVTEFVKQIIEKHSSSSADFERMLTVANFPRPDMSSYEANKRGQDEYLFQNGTTQMVINLANGGLRIRVNP